MKWGRRDQKMNSRKPDNDDKHTTDQKMISPSPSQQAVIALTLVLLMLVTPGPVIEAITAWLVMPVVPPSESEFPTDKVVHFAMFAVCAFLSFRAWGVRFGVMMVLLALMMFAGLTELLQMLIPGRSGNLLDYLADATGVLMGYWWYRRSTGREWINNKE
jgi:hypothetical protein